MSDKILEVKNLKISFRTQGGTVKAVRDISFDLERGETLAIVGESGSGKSVTSKAILGILAGNSIIEGGEILFDGKDLLRIDEEDMHKIRGDKIAMIFQDPLSSLNPIVKIGKQITEAMLLKNKATRKMSRKEFNTLLSLLKVNMLEVLGKENEAKINEYISTFDKFNIEGIKLEEAYNVAYTTAEELIGQTEDLLFHLERGRKYDVRDAMASLIKRLPKVKNKFFSESSNAKIDEILLLLEDLEENCLNNKNAAMKEEGVRIFAGMIGVWIRRHYRKESLNAKIKRGKLPRVDELISALSELKKFLGELTAQPRPDFFRIGFYKMKNPDADLTEMPIAELNDVTLNYLNENFMLEFIAMETAALKHSANKTIEAKKAVLEALPAVRAYFEGEIDKKGANELSKRICPLIANCIDKLDILKDSTTYTFKTSFNSAINKYFTAVVNNPREEARFARQSARRERLIARGKTVEWKVVPKNVYDLDELKANIVKMLDNVQVRYTRDVENADKVDMNAKALALVDHLKETASKVVYRLTKRMAKEKAIKLMDEVGIPESRIRYNQYPFEFSGGMRQRIVIAIALSANPDILICDEPTTALDVTIQAQILELINNLKRERNLSVIFITHDLGVVANVADKIGVMYAGKIVEYGTADDIFYDPRHPYTWALLSSMPDLDTDEKLEAIPGTPPNMIYPPVGDAFADRNKYALKIDFEMQPPQFEVSPTHWAATWLLHPDAPKAEPPHIIVDRIARMTGKAGADNG